mgnify:CR=1 FL=1
MVILENKYYKVIDADIITLNKNKYNSHDVKNMEVVYTSLISGKYINKYIAYIHIDMLNNNNECIVLSICLTKDQTGMYLWPRDENEDDIIKNIIVKVDKKVMCKGKLQKGIFMLSCYNKKEQHYKLWLKSISKKIRNLIDADDIEISM